MSFDQQQNSRNDDSRHDDDDGGDDDADKAAFVVAVVSGVSLIFTFLVSVRFQDTGDDNFGLFWLTFGRFWK